MLGNMMPTQLTLGSLMSHGKRHFSSSEIVSITSDYSVHRTNLGEVFRRSARLANYFSQKNLGQGERIATLGWNDFRHLEIYYGVSCYGAVCHTINPRLHPEQLAFIINDAQDCILFVDVMFIELVKSIQDKLPSIQQFIVMSSDRNVLAGCDHHWTSYEQVIAEQNDCYPWPELDENTACSLCYTSGTTGNPKGVLYSHRALVLHTMAECAPDVFGVSRRDVILPVVPMFHVNAWGIPYLPAMTGCKLVFAGQKCADAATLVELFEQEKVTITAGVPTVWKLLRDYLELHKIQLSTLKKLVVGGSAMPPHLYRYFETAQSLAVIHAWGMTEMSPLGTVNHTQPKYLAETSAEQQFEHKLRQGFPVFGIELKLLNDDGKEVQWDGKTSGSLMARGPWVADRYYNKPETRSTSGWFDTGDVAVMTTDGCMKITDRKKDVIKSGGEWISSIDIENAISLHAQVSMAAVIGIEHPKWDERPLLVIERNSQTELTLAEAHAWLANKIAKWWLPDDLVYVDKIPLTATGKVHKLVLREQFVDYKLPN